MAVLGSVRARCDAPIASALCPRSDMLVSSLGGGFMRRRKFIALLGGAAGWPITTPAQPTMPVIGFLSSRERAETAHLVAAFRRGLQETGYVEGEIEAVFASLQATEALLVASDPFLDDRRHRVVALIARQR